MSTSPTDQTEGERIVEERVAIHGDPLVNIRKIAQMWSTLLQVAVTPIDVCHMMIQFKLAREIEKHHPDNYDDIEGYVAIARLFRKEDARADRAHPPGT